MYFDLDAYGAFPCTLSITGNVYLDMTSLDLFFYYIVTKSLWVYCGLFVHKTDLLFK